METRDQLLAPQVFKRTSRQGLPPGTVNVSRPSKWGNPFRISARTDRATVVEQFEDLVREQVERGKRDLTELSGKNLGCWCHNWDGKGPNPRYCHADILLGLANPGLVDL